MGKGVGKESDHHHRRKGVAKVSEDDDDEEIGSYLNSEKETELKRKIWELMNKDYGISNANANNKRKRKKNESTTTTTTDARKKRANEKTTERRSWKINYDLLNKDLGVAGDKAGGDHVEAAQEEQEEEEEEDCNYVDGAADNWYQNLGFDDEEGGDGRNNFDDYDGF